MMKQVTNQSSSINVIDDEYSTKNVDDDIKKNKKKNQDQYHKYITCSHIDKEWGKDFVGITEPVTLCTSPWEVLREALYGIVQSIKEDENEYENAEIVKKEKQPPPPPIDIAYIVVVNASARIKKKTPPRPPRRRSTLVSTSIFSKFCDEDNNNNNKHSDHESPKYKLIIDDEEEEENNHDLNDLVRTAVEETSHDDNIKQSPSPFIQHPPIISKNADNNDDPTTTSSSTSSLPFQKIIPTITLSDIVPEVTTRPRFRLSYD